VTSSAEAQRPAASPGELLPPGLVFADTPSRIVAYVLDSVAISAILAIPSGLLGLYDYAYSGASYPPLMPRSTFIVSILLSFGISAAYFLWFWTGGRRATPGQWVFGIQVANAFDGRSLTVTQAVERWLAMGWWLGFALLLPFFGIAMGLYAMLGVWWIVLVISMIASPTKQGIHDRFARSALVRPAGRGNRWAVGCVWILIIGTLFEVAVLIAFFSMMSALQDSTVFPPGMNPLDYFTEQIRVFWPA